MRSRCVYVSLVVVMVLRGRRGSPHSSSRAASNQFVDW